MTKNDLTREWLTCNAVIAFIGAFMMGQTLDRPAGAYGLPYGLEIPGIPDPGTFLIAGFLFLLSFSLVLAYLVPPSTTAADGRLGCWTVLKSQCLATATVSDPNETELNLRLKVPSRC